MGIESQEQVATKERAKEGVNRRGFGLKGEIRQFLVADYHSQLVEKIKSQNNTITLGRLTVRLAEEFGFCYGVDFALNLAYETRRKFPDRRIFLTNEIIHNPRVNSRLREMGVEFIDCSAGNPHRFAHIKPDDVVMLPAFGAPAGEYRDLQEKSCLVVDTTCGSVVAVWKRVQRYAREGFTAIIHGKHAHEETRATSSQVVEYDGGKFLVVLDKAEAAYVCRYIVEGGDGQEFKSRFKDACSPGFEPESDLRRVGLANQTTMLSSESLEIAEMIRRAIAQRYGEHSLAERYRHFDTICTATQDRQDAVGKLVRGDVDLMIVVGGYNSSNTSHLCEISSLHKPAYHIGDASCIVSASCIRHKPVGESEEILTRDWLPDGDVKIGVTAGASTPDRIVGEVIDRIAKACEVGEERINGEA
ncbi:MAG TPA: 4-hydroxy-3-methylbut-2-enyl diphosphate reductase [Blastocatellia bacterium]|jgi:4-hydroxy-3-methylbut-2-enyl diphosphate reductase|nr:4-hydroxy-3-methylbut-2-enyl diphosphate reductase [Blastocatellia bacterium]